jgi:uridine kinase
MPFLIGIAGPSGAGKTLLAKTVGAALRAPILSLDSYYLDLAHLSYEERARTNFDDPASLDDGLLAGHLAAIAAGEDVEIPVYDFSRHTRAARVERLHAAEYVILEGLFALYWGHVRRLLGLRVYVEAPDETCFARRLDRDLRERGRSRESIYLQYAGSVRPMAARYIYPSRRFADVVVSGLDPVEQSAAMVVRQATAPPVATR